jgi:hypothetical protein
MKVDAPFRNNPNLGINFETTSEATPVNEPTFATTPTRDSTVATTFEVTYSLPFWESGLREHLSKLPTTKPAVVAQRISTNGASSTPCAAKSDADLGYQETTILPPTPEQ